MTVPASRPPAVRRILVLRPRALGDVLQCTPALRALRHGFPDAELHVVVDDALEPLLRHNPHVSRLWLLPRRATGRARRWVRLYWGLARAHFDLVLDLHGSPRTALLAWLTRAPLRFGFALRGRGVLYNRRVPRDTDRSGRRRLMYAAQTNLEMVARCGVCGPSLEDSSLVFEGDPRVETRVEALLADILPRRPRVGIAATGTCAARLWPLASFARLADILVQAGCSVLLLWGPGERGTALRLQGAMLEPSTLAPPTDLFELAALLARLDLVVGNDSGPKHLAVARRTPTLTIFGPTDPVNWNPDLPQHVALRADVPCLGCNFTSCSHHLCMRLLPPDRVAARALAMLALPFTSVGRGCAS